MRAETDSRAAACGQTKAVVDVQKMIREDGDIDETAKNQIVGFLSYLAVDGLKLRTITSYAASLRQLAKACPAKGFLLLQRQDVRQIIAAAQNRGYRTSTVNLFKARFLRFQRWLREEYGYPAEYPDSAFAGKKLEPGEKPVEFKGIRSACRYALPYGPENLPTREEVRRMIEAAAGPRDRAIVAVLLESAARLSEFLGLKIRSVEHTPYGWKVHVDGKTGKRPVMLVNSGPYLAAWLTFHPFRDNPEAPLWVPAGCRRNARRHFERTGQMLSMSGNGIRHVLQELGKRADVRKKLNPHAFRHARATELAKHLKESQLRAYMGWTPGSAMPGLYVHLSGRDTDTAILAAHGIEVPDSSITLGHPRKCAACQYDNPNSAKLCLGCKQPLGTEASALADEVVKPDALVCVLREPLAVEGQEPRFDDTRLFVYTADALKRLVCEKWFSFVSEELGEGEGTFWFRTRDRG